MSIHLLGGGRDVARCGALLPSFVDEARERAGRRPAVIAVLLVVAADDEHSAARWRDVLLAAGATADEVQVHRIVEGERFSASAVDADAVFVGGGLTPAYHDAVADIVAALGERVAAGLPYAGFSAGAAIAARRALVGGYRWQGVEVVSEDAGEELDELDVRDGLGFVPFTLDVHAAQWGTLSRLVAAVAAGLVESGVAIDEYTALVVSDTDRVVGEGRVWQVERMAGGAARVERLPAADG